MTSRTEELIDDRVSFTQSKKAVTALMKHARSFAEKKAETELLPGKEQHVWLVLAVKKMQPSKKLKPQKMHVFSSRLHNSFTYYMTVH